MKILITGAGSMLGVHILNEISNRGHCAVGLARKPPVIAGITATSSEIIRGDITKIGDIERAVIGCDAIIHAAALTDHSISSYEKFHEVNVTGSLNIIDAAIKYNIRRLVYISTANTIGYGTIDNPGSEEHPPLPPYTQSHYVRSKIEAEKVLVERAKGTGVEVVIINPSFILGAFDTKPTSGEAVLRGLKSRVITVTRGGKNFVNAKDVARAAFQAIEKGIHARKYLVTGTNMDFTRFYKEFNSITGSKKRILVVPTFLFILAGLVMQPLFRAGLNTRINLVNMRMICTGNYYKPGRTIEELLTPVTPVSEGILESVNWFRDNWKTGP